MVVEWSKSDSGVVVHLYTRGVDRLDQQHEAYRGRTELIRDGMTRGNLSLRLKNVRCSDQGEYTCSCVWLFAVSVSSQLWTPVAQWLEPHKRETWVRLSETLSFR
uniref:Ig-like domain-containing protein n=1 Tax=Callorhinchus milii TaxID=7868 RepID=A0A4W3H7F9_CALMI